MVNLYKDDAPDVDKLEPTTLIVPNSNKRPKTDLIDAKLWSLFNIIGSGSLYRRIQKFYSDSTVTLMKELKQLLEEGFIRIIPPDESKDLYLFPKPVRIGLNQEETQIFWHIVDGMSVHEFIVKIDMSLEKLVETIIKIILKKKMVLTNRAGKILEPWHIYSSLGLAVNVKPVKLVVQCNGRITTNPGSVLVDNMLYDIWKQQLMGQELQGLSLIHMGKSIVFNLQKRKGVKNEIFFSPKDIDKYDLKNGMIIECMPVT